MDANVVALLQFVNKLAENMGMADLLNLHHSVALPRQHNEVFFTLDPNLYPTDKQANTIAVIGSDDEVDFTRAN